MKQLDYILNRAGSIADNVCQKTEEFVGVSKLKIKCSQTKSDIDDQFKKLGSSYYKMLRNNVQNDKVIRSICKDIDALYKKLERLEAEIKSVQTDPFCPYCNFKNRPDAKFCSKCGAVLNCEDKDLDDKDD